MAVLYNPEFIAQGSILRDLQHADMVLIGGEDPAVMDRYQAVYHKIQPGMPAEVIIKTGERTVLTYMLHPLTRRVAASMKEQ